MISDSMWGKRKRRRKKKEMMLDISRKRKLSPWFPSREDADMA